MARTRKFEVEKKRNAEAAAFARNMRNAPVRSLLGKAWVGWS